MLASNPPSFPALDVPSKFRPCAFVINERHGPMVSRTRHVEHAVRLLFARQLTIHAPTSFRFAPSGLIQPAMKSLQFQQFPNFAIVISFHDVNAYLIALTS